MLGPRGQLNNQCVLFSVKLGTIKALGQVEIHVVTLDDEDEDQDAQTCLVKKCLGVDNSQSGK